jgi:hypothetical protein
LVEEAEGAFLLLSIVEFQNGIETIEQGAQFDEVLRVKSLTVEVGEQS